MDKGKCGGHFCTSLWCLEVGPVFNTFTHDSNKEIEV